MMDPITESDLNAYIDGQLDLARRIEVEEHLAANPRIAARVMADLRTRDALSAAFAPSHPNPQSGPVPERIALAARRLDRALTWRRIGQRFQRAAVVALLVGTGWLMHAETGGFGVPGTIASTHSPPFVEDAIQARQASQIRARVASLRPTPAYDRSGIEAATGIHLPDLPQDWRVRDLQIFPTRSGAGVEVAIDAAALGPVALFATRTEDGEALAPEVTRSAEAVTVYWKAGHTAFALSGGADEPALGRAAATLGAPKP
ncbi:anti-sigma factor family protein [Methylobacterium nodulans]|uniref:Putative transmembrane anti-sigma factor n=1 Tax=Methylobacterium nodulans (strain LMG 21967 / CNCM I-2342 / ORS 2060) TaxID=460265 RepID=B8IBU7_METNO|nr:zf-HC2 domain-containing protein [Methylobacterium nodulans]ACL59351.1 putative transmembrane anti-sigma factor [Methylobacterium nodulans ORS 2060]